MFMLSEKKKYKKKSIKKRIFCLRNIFPSGFVLYVVFWNDVTLKVLYGGIIWMKKAK